MPNPGRKPSRTRNSTSSSNSTDTYASEVAVPCKQCEKMVSNNGLQCSFCENWYCQPCTELTPAVLRSLDDSPDCLMWFCKACLTALPGLKKLLVTVTACETEHKDIKERLGILEQKEKELQIKSSILEDKVNNIEDLEQNRDYSQNINNNLSDMVDSVMLERADQEKRRLNLICFNMEESNNETSLGRRDDDLNKLQGILINHLRVDSEIVISDLVRLGKKLDDSVRPRPLRFKVKDMEGKNIILRAGKYMRNSENESIKNMYITPDLTKKQRDEAYKLRQEKKQRIEAGEENLRIVRGKIVKNP